MVDVAPSGSNTSVSKTSHATELTRSVAEKEKDEDPVTVRGVKESSL